MIWTKCNEILKLLEEWQAVPSDSALRQYLFKKVYLQYFELKVKSRFWTSSRLTRFNGYTKASIKKEHRSRIFRIERRPSVVSKEMQQLPSPSLDEIVEKFLAIWTFKPSRA